MFAEFTLLNSASLKIVLFFYNEKYFDFKVKTYIYCVLDTENAVHYFLFVNSYVIVSR